jgi:L-lactate dehydrogenase (cytochrome)
VKISNAINVADLREMARKRLPRAVFDYIDGGADEEITLRDNCAVYEDVIFRPRGAVAIPQVDLSTTMLGARLSLPFALTAVGSCRMFSPRGDEAAARAAGKAGTGYLLSTLSGTRLEDARAATTGPAWYQLYLLGGRDAALAAIERAKKAGYAALFVTVDTPVSGNRERDFRNRVKDLLNPRPWNLGAFFQVLSRPRWLWGFLGDGGLMEFPNVVVPGKGTMPYADIGAALESSVVAWSDFKWIRDAWKGPIVAKGVLTGDDAKRAVDEGVKGIVVSNHGGRQLDGVSPTFRALPEVAAAVRGQTEVFLDGGVRRGSDVVKAICLGASAVLVGRAYAYGLGAAGEVGVARAIEILKADVSRTLKLLGCPSIASLDASYLQLPHDWRTDLHG